jgi:hypothetical protein
MPAAKTANLPSASMLDPGYVEKKPQMIINDNLLTFIAQCIMADLEWWEIMLTSMHGKASLQWKFIAFLSKHLVLSRGAKVPLLKLYRSG